MEVDDVHLFESLLERYLPFYEELRTRARRPRTAAQRQFQDVAWGKAEPVTDHEKAYVYYLKKRSSASYPVKPVVIDEIEQYPMGCRPIPPEAARKWDEEWVDTRGSNPHWN